MQGHGLCSALVGALTFLGASMASAQEFRNLSALLDRGAQRVGGAELQALVLGATMSGLILRENSRVEFEIAYAGDGTLNGRLYGLSPHTSPAVQGTWTVDDEGRLCTNIVTMASGHQKTCIPFYKLENTYYAASSDAASAVVRPRKIQR
jgi:hypothetical protein